MGYILIVSALFPPEPVVSAYLSSDIYNALKERGKEVRVLHPKPTRPNGYVFVESIVASRDEVIADSFTCPQSRLFGRLRESWSFGIATKKYINQHHKDIDLIYANTWPLFAQFYLSIAAKKYRIPYYIHIQDIYPESYCFKMPVYLGKCICRVFRPMDKYVLQNATLIFPISQAMLSYLSETRDVDSSKFKLVRNWQDDKNFIEAYKPFNQRSTVCEIMYLGSINPSANVSLILKAFSCLNKSMFHLSIIGNGPDKDCCIKLADQLGLDVTFDTVTPEMVAYKQGNADILVLCLKKGIAKTASPSKLTAYMLTGRPIIASVDLDSDCADIIRDAKCGIVVEPECKDSLCNAIQELSSESHDTLNKMGRSAFDYAMKHLSKKSNLGILLNSLTN